MKINPDTRKKIIIYIALAVALLSLIFGIKGCIKASHPKFSGTLEFTEHSLGARVPGRVVSLLVDEGDEVKKGQLLATLDRHEQAKRDYDRADSLLKQGGTNQQAVEYARLTLEDQQVLSPVDGVVLLKVREAGEVAAAGSAVVIVGDRSEIWVRIFVPEGMINRVFLGQRATLKLDGLKRAFHGRVNFIATKGEFTPRNVQTPEERVTQTFAVKVLLDEPSPFLHPGVAADVVLDMKTKKK